ncbi:MAG: beta-ketoacyl-[acyl-carrier-protein] synthase family protein, partial [Armatimonadetes bacterium]|nr:beta-ketoacyl-[acyl-carrier-protein] synthase family protein [Armatimonadota bacterium]
MSLRIAITGLGCVAPLGTTVAEFWRLLLAGERALAPIERFDPSGLRNVLAGEVKGWRFFADDWGLSAAPSLATQFALAAAREALADAGLPAQLDGLRATAVMGTNFGGADRWEKYAADFLDGDPRAGDFFAWAFDETPRVFRSVFGLASPARVVSMACSSGTVALGLAADLLRAGRADVVLAGGHDCLALTPLAGLSNLRTITADDIKPFSADRSGTLFGEGAAYLVLEPLDAALARGAVPYAEVLGWWENNNGYHLTAPDPGAEGMTAVLAACLRASGLAPEDVDYINAHGTGTEYHDPAETTAIKNVLGQHAYEIPVSSIKGALGHLMGAAGAIEA